MKQEIIELVNKMYKDIGGDDHVVLYDTYIMSEDVKKLHKLVNNLTIPVVMPRYFIDKRAGCAAVRDREHPKYDKDYQGLHQDTPDVVVYAHGFQNHEKKCWDMRPEHMNYLELECERLNSSNGA